jgi:hypothetical protein
MAHGTERIDNAHDHAFSRNVDAGQDAGPVEELLEYRRRSSPPLRPASAPRADYCFDQTRTIAAVPTRGRTIARLGREALTGLT